MFLPFLAAAAIALGLIRLGALSVWVSVLLLGLKALAAAVIALVGLLLWRLYRGSC